MINEYLGRIYQGLTCGVIYIILRLSKVIQETSGFLLYSDINVASGFIL